MEAYHDEWCDPSCDGVRGDPPCGAALLSFDATVPLPAWVVDASVEDAREWQSGHWGRRPGAGRRRPPRGDGRAGVRVPHRAGRAAVMARGDRAALPRPRVRAPRPGTGPGVGRPHTVRGRSEAVSRVRGRYGDLLDIAGQHFPSEYARLLERWGLDAEAGGPTASTRSTLPPAQRSGPTATVRRSRRAGRVGRGDDAVAVVPLATRRTGAAHLDCPASMASRDPTAPPRLPPHGVKQCPTGARTC